MENKRHLVAILRQVLSTTDKNAWNKEVVPSQLSLYRDEYIRCMERTAPYEEDGAKALYGILHSFMTRNKVEWNRSWRKIEEVCQELNKLYLSWER